MPHSRTGERRPQDQRPDPGARSPPRRPRRRPARHQAPARGPVHRPGARARPGRGGPARRPTGVPHPGLRQVEVRGGAARQGVAAEGHQQLAIKEMKYRPKIGGGDFDTKTRKVGEFLDEGHKVKITIMFRGREVAHPELGKQILDRIAEQLPAGQGRGGTQARRAQHDHGPGPRPQGRGPAAKAGSPETPPRRPNPRRRPTRPLAERGRRPNAMPKMKTHRGAAKRFKVTGTGKILRRKAFRAHMLEKKSSVRTRRLARASRGHRRRQAQVKRLLGPLAQLAASSSHATTSRQKGDLHGQGQACRPRQEAPPRRPRAGQGVLRQQEPLLPVRQRAGHALPAVRLPRPAGPQGRLPPALDPAHQRRLPASTA